MEKFQSKDLLMNSKKYLRKADTEIISAWNALLLDLPQNRINLLKRIRKKYDIFLLSNTNSIHINEFRKQIGETKYLKFYNLFKKVYYSYVNSIDLENLIKKLSKLY